MTPGSSDRVVRAVTQDGAFRVLCATTTATSQVAAGAQHAEGDVARLLGDMLTGAVLVRETMAPGLRVQGILQGADGRGRVVADAHPDGDTRGLIQIADAA